MLEKLLVAGVAGLLGLLPVLFQWLSARSAARSRNKRIELLSEELKFLEQWVALSGAGLAEGQTQQGAPPARVIQTDLAVVLTEYRSLRETELEHHARPEDVSLIRKVFLLFRPTTGMGWLIHTSFYFLTITMIVMLASDLASPTHDAAGQNEFSSLLIGLLVIFGPIEILLVRAGVKLRERLLAKKQSEQP